MKNKFTKILIVIISAIAAGLAITFIIALAWNEEVVIETNQMKCEGGDVTACKEYILEQKNRYAELETEMKSLTQEADRARERVEEWIDGLGLI